MHRPKLPGMGLRTIKTALAVMLCLLFFSAITYLSRFVPREGGIPAQFLYFLLHRPDPIFACVAAVISMQSTVEASLQLGSSRVVGTTVGALFGLLFLWLDTSLMQRRLNILLATLGVVLVINCCLLLKRPASVPIACITFLILLITRQEEFPYFYAANRLIDTAIGIFFSVTVNVLVRRSGSKQAPPKDD